MQKMVCKDHRLNLLSEFAETVVVSPERDPLLRQPEMSVFHLVLSCQRLKEIMSVTRAVKLCLDCTV